MADRQYVTQCGRPAIDKAFNGLRTITRLSDVTGTGTTAANIEAEVFLAYGTADVEFTIALLVRRGMQQVSTGKSDFVGRLTEVYQEFTSGMKVSVGEDQIVNLEDGRTMLIRKYVALAAEADSLAAAVGDILGGRACQEAKINKQGVGAEIVETYISAGILATTTEYTKGSKAEIRSITYYNGTPSTPAGFTLIGTAIQNPNGLPGKTYRFAKGDGLVEQDIDTKLPGMPGLRRVTNIAFGAKVVPDGIVDVDNYREADGYRIYTTSSLQTAAGGADPLTVSVPAERWVSFTYPGRAKAFTEVFDGKTMLAAFLSPQVTTQVRATVTISYVTSPVLGVISDFWNPSDWATIKKQWVGSFGRQTSEIRALPGYRTVDATPVTFTGSGTDSAIEGSVIYAGSTARITITGGPADPGGGTWTLDAEVQEEPVFTATDGTSYYRKTVITADIPAQTALPV